MRHEAIQPDTGKKHHLHASTVYERELIVKGTRIFLDRGWPSGQFTAAMARRAGEGLMPDWYENSRSEYKEKLRMESEASDVIAKGVLP
jgi:hypothetical protein